PLWAALQTGVGAAALWVAPGPGAALVGCALVAGVALRLPWVGAAGCAGALGVVTFLVSSGARGGALSLVDAFAYSAAYAAAAWVGRLFRQRLEEERAHRRTVLELEEAHTRI